MPPGGKGVFLLGLDVNNVDAILAKTKRGLERFGQSRPIFVGDRDAILNHLHSWTKPIDLRVGVHAHDFAVDPNAEVTLLLQKMEKIARLGFLGNRNPERDENVFRGSTPP